MVATPIEAHAKGPTLEEDGFAIFEDVATADDLTRIVASFESYLRRAGPEEAKTGFVNDAHHADFMWDARTLPRVREAFASCWGDDDLLVSFDKANALRGHNASNKRLVRGIDWHTDQNCHERAGLSGRRRCLQGMLTLMPQDEQSGGLALWPRSLHHFEAFCAEHGGGAQHGVQHVPVDESAARRFGELHALGPLPAAPLTLKAGSLVVWDSRTLHRVYGSRRPAGVRARLCCYVAMLPRALVDAPTLARRRRAYELHEGGSSWVDGDYSHSGRKVPRARIDEAPGHVWRLVEGIGAGAADPAAASAVE